MKLYPWSWTRQMHFADAVRMYSALLGLEYINVMESIAVDSDMHQVTNLQAYSFPNLHDADPTHVGMYFYRIYGLKLSMRVVWQEMIIYNPSKDDGTCSGFPLTSRFSISDGYYNQPMWHYFGKARPRRRKGEFHLEGATFLTFGTKGFDLYRFYDQDNNDLNPQDIRAYLEAVRHAKV